MEENERRREENERRREEKERRCNEKALRCKEGNAVRCNTQGCRKNVPHCLLVRGIEYCRGECSITCPVCQETVYGPDCVRGPGWVICVSCHRCKYCGGRLDDYDFCHKCRAF